MESRYGIGINNRYALFLEPEDGDMAIKKPVDPKTPANPEPAKPMKKAAPADLKKDKAPVSQNNRATKDNKPNNREDKENRNNRYEGKRVLDARKPQDGPRESREERNNRRNQAPRDGPGPDGDNKRGGGRGGMRGGRGGRGGGRGGKRDFDRKSGDDKTGVKAVDKKEGSGSHNWGTFEDEMKAEEDKANTSTDMNDSNVETENANDANVPNEAEEARRAAEEEEAKTMTLDEWKALQAAKKAGPKFNVRKAGEGSDLDPKWKKTYAYKKEKETHDDDEDEEHELYPQRANRQKKVLDIEFNFNDANGPAGPDRGGRGGGRGRGGRGGRGDRRERGDRPGGRGGYGGKPRGGKGGEAPNVNDEMSFPSLG